MLVSTVSVSTFSHTLHSTDLEGRIRGALEAMRAGIPVILLDDFDRENEADLIVAAEKLTVETMALMIRECSGIVCLCLSDEKVRALELPPMAAENGSRYGTPFTVSIEARHGVSTGVSAGWCGWRRSPGRSRGYSVPTPRSRSTVCSLPWPPSFPNRSRH